MDYVSYIEENPRWEVTLNNGEHFWMDDGNPEYQTYSAWIRLKEYCQENSLYITNMWFGFRDNVHHLPPNQNGYYFCKGSRGCFGVPKTMQLFFVGTVNTMLTVTCWKVPEMLEEQTEIRNIDRNSQCLIMKKDMCPSMGH